MVEEDPDRLTSKHTFAGPYHAEGQVDKAVELLEHVVAMNAMVLRGGYPSRLASQPVFVALYAKLEADREASV